MQKKQSKHHKLVSSVLVAVLAFTAIVNSAQLSTISDQLSGNVTYVASHEAGHTDPPPPDGGGGAPPPPPPDGGTQPPPTTSGSTGTYTPPPTTTSGSNCGSGNYWNGSSCQPNSSGSTTTTGTTGTSSTGTAPVMTVGQCQSQMGTWNASTNTCSYGSSGTTTTGTSGSMSMTCSNPGQPASYYMDSGSCGMCGYFWEMGSGSTAGKCTSTMPSGMNMNTSGMMGTSGSTAATCTAPGDAWMGTYCQYASNMNMNTNMQPVMTVDQCKSQMGTWNASTSTCQYGTSTTGTTTTNMPYPMPMPMMGAMNCAMGEYYDFAFGKCMKAVTSTTMFQDNNYFNQFQSSTFTCPPWDMYCQQQQQKGISFEEDYSDVGCVDSGQARFMKFEIERQISELEHEFKYIDFSEASDSLAVAEAQKKLETASAVDLSDPCELGKAQSIVDQFNQKDGLREQMNAARELADFRREVKRILADIERERAYVTDETAIKYFDLSEEKANALIETPPYDAEQPWKMWESLDPACMRFGGFGPMPMPMMPMGGSTMGMQGGFGGSKMGGQGMGMPGMMCTDEELKETPRGLFQLAMKVNQEARFTSHFENICEDVEAKLAKFASTVAAEAPAYSGEAGLIVSKGTVLVGKCKVASDKEAYFPQFDKLRFEAEALMSKAGIDMGDFEDDMDFNFAGTDMLLGDDLMARINALIEQKLSEGFAQMQRVFDEKLAKAMTMFQTAAMDAITNAMALVDEDVAAKMAHSLELFTGLPEEASDIASAVTETTSEVVESLTTITQFDAEVEDAVNEALEVVTDRPLPAVVLAEVQEIVETAVNVAKNGGDVEVELDKIAAAIPSDAELNKMQIDEGTWAFADVTPGEGWYDVYAIEAHTKGVVDGTVDPVTGYAELNAGKTCNMVECGAMLVKALDITTATPSAEVTALVGDATWAGPFIQGLANEIGLSKVQESFAKAGDAGSPISRGIIADWGTAAYENIVGTQNINPSSVIGTYTDFGQMDSDAQHDFAVMKVAGVITGADNGTKANDTDDTNRAEVTKMFSTLQDAVKEAQLYEGYESVEVDFSTGVEAGVEGGF